MLLASTHVHGACVRVYVRVAGDLFACVRLQSIYGRRFPRVNVREEGARQPEGQTRCSSSAGRVNATGFQSRCGLDITPERLAGSSHQPAAFVWLLFMKPEREQKRKKERKHFRSDNRRQRQNGVVVALSVTIDKMTVFSLSSFNFPLLNNRRPEF